MISKDIESASHQTNNEVILQSATDSLQTLTANQLCSTHDIKVLDPRTLSRNESEVNQKPFLSSDYRRENEKKIDMECKVNVLDIEAPKGLFGDKDVRNGFIRKVYTILFVQIVFTTIGAGIMFTFFWNKLNTEQIRKNKDGFALFVLIILLIVSFVVIIGVMITFCCSVSARRTVPTNFILLGLFTMAETFIVGFCCAQHNGEHIFISFAITGVVVLAITLLATTPWFDITNCGCLLFILLILHMAMGIVVWIIVIAFQINAKPLYLILAILGAFLWSLYLLYDTQLILGGKKYELNPEEYIYGAICLYIDIIQIFLYILQITQNST